MAHLTSGPVHGISHPVACGLRRNARFGTARQLLHVVLLLLVAGFSVHAALAQTPVPVRPQRPFPQVLATWKNALDKLEADVARPGLVQAEIERLRPELEAVRQDATGTAASARVQLQAARAVLAPLEPVQGPPGPDGKPAAPSPESDAVKAQREQLAQEVAEIDGRVKQAEAIAARADQLLQRLARRREMMVLRTLTARGPSPLSATTWSAAATGLRETWDQIASDWRSWAGRGLFAAGDHELPLDVAAAVVLVGLFVSLRILRRRLHGRPATAEPSYRERLLAAVVEAVAMVALPICAVVLVCFVILLADPPANIAAIIVDVGKALSFALLVYGVTETGLSPERPAWRLLPFSDESAKLLSDRLHRLVWCLAIIQISAAVVIPDREVAAPTTAIFTAMATILIVLLGLPPLRTGAWTRAPATQGETATVGAIGGGKWAIARLLLSLLPPLACAAAFAGFTNLAAALLYSSINSLVAITMALVLHALTRDLLQAGSEPNVPTGRWLRHALGLAADSELRWWYLILLAVDLVILSALCVVIPALWGVETRVIWAWVSALWTGVKIGGRTISLVDILGGALAFIIAVVLVGVVRRGLREHVMPSLAVPDPVRFTVDAAVNYIGLALAVMVGIVALGVDLSNLALIVGALSVGIGLGLQNLANNVISGVVLLFERPIRVGDRISIGGFEGIVRRINVRATEIETFERALVIMPNSQLLQNAVVNASYADFVGRVDLVIKVPFGNDLSAVERVMLAAAEAHPQVARFPAPQVLLHKTMDASGAEMELRVWLRDRSTVVATRNELGRAVMQALPGAGVNLAPAPLVVPGAITQPAPAAAPVAENDG